MSGIKVTVIEGVVCVSGEIDMTSAKVLDRALAAVEPPKMVDMRGVSVMDSSGLNVLLTHYRCLVGQEGALRVVAMSRAVQRVLEVTGLFRTLTEDSTQLVRDPPLLEVPMGRRVELVRSAGAWPTLRHKGHRQAPRRSSGGRGCERRRRSVVSALVQRG